MRTRTSSLLTVLALALAACGGGSSTDTTTTTDDPPLTTTTTEQVVAAPEAALLAYALEPGVSFDYEVDIDQTIHLTTEGDAAALGEGEEVPGEMLIDIVGTTTFSQSVAEGPEQGTFEVTITGDFTDLSFTGTVDGEPVEDAEIPDLAKMEPINVTVVVDEQGKIVIEDDELAGLFGGDLGGLGALGEMGAPGVSPGSFIGPPLPDEKVTVGDTWTETTETPGLFDDEVIVTELSGEVTGTDLVDGFDVLVIETEMTTSAFSFDMAEFLIGFFTAFIPEDASEEDLAELEMIKEHLRFAFSFDESVGVMTTWFDAEAGLARRAEASGGAHFVMDINMPDEESGEMVGFVVDMNIDRKITYRLLGEQSA